MARPSTFPAPWRPLVAAAGSVTLLARHLGVDPATLWRWAHDRQVPTGDNAAALASFCDHHSLRRPTPAP